uniref:Tubulin alpha chain n=1 Tax=Schistocephalus solidus TaxID=70667 RepID=A0A0X3P670_SCHSO
MREVVTVHFGQCGSQMGNAVWELFCAEHAVGLDGTLFEEPHVLEWHETFFSLSGSGHYVPRAIFVDLEPTVIDEVRVGPWRKLFHPDKLITGCEDASNNFARGFFTAGKLILGRLYDEFRRTMETCDFVQGILFFKSLGGGTGAGLSAALLDLLTDYRKVTKVEVPIYPSPAISTSITEPYNSVLGEHFSIEDYNMALLMDNEALYDICTRYLPATNTTYNGLNRIISVVISSITASVRFENLLGGDFTVVQTNLIPYPRIHFPLINFAPCICLENKYFDEGSTRSITRQVFERENQLIKVDPAFGKYMSCTLLYRGDVDPSQVYYSVMELKTVKCVDFVDWCPTGFKVGIAREPPVCRIESGIAQTVRNVVMLANNSAVSQAWERMLRKYHLLYCRRAFLHWYLCEGMEKAEFVDAYANISSLVKDYEEVTADC